MKKTKILKLYIYLFCMSNLIVSLILIFIIFFNIILHGGFILYEFDRTLMFFEFTSVIISLFICPFIFYDLLINKEIYY